MGYWGSARHVPRSLPRNSFVANVQGAGRLEGSQVCQRGGEHEDSSHVTGPHECCWHLRCVPHPGFSFCSCSPEFQTWGRRCQGDCRTQEAEETAWGVG